MEGYRIAVVGATGAVGSKMLEMLATTKLPIQEVKLLASKRSAGQTRLFKGEEKTIEELTVNSFGDVDIALFSAGGGISKQFAPAAVEAGAIVIDNTSFYRMNPDVPLVVPEVNKEALRQHQGIIANPNCSTIQMMAALEPIRQQVGLERVLVSTYQAVSGAGAHAIQELKDQAQDYLDGKSYEELNAAILPCGSDKKHYPIAFNALPQIDQFGEGGYTLEEWKMIHETKKIMSDDSLKVVATCVRIPVISGHSESVYIETKEPTTVAEIQAWLKEAPGIVLQDDVNEQLYPQAATAVGKKETFVGRIRQDVDVPNGFHLWIVSDNLLKGAAWNSVQIAETLHEMDLIKK